MAHSVSRKLGLALILLDGTISVLDGLKQYADMTRTRIDVNMIMHNALLGELDSIKMEMYSHISTARNLIHISDRLFTTVSSAEHEVGAF